MDYSFERHSKVLELDAVLNRLSEEAVSPAARDRLRGLVPSNDPAAVSALLKETEEAYILLSRFSAPSLYANESIPSVIKRAELRSTLSVKELIGVSEMLRVVAAAKSWRSDLRDIAGMTVDRYFDGLFPNRHIEDRINSVIKSEDEIYDRASPALYDIRRKKSACSSKVKSILDKIIKGPMAKYLQDAIVTQRDGRYVVPLKVEHRAEIGGIVHDTSATGYTVFVEPMSVVEANNEMRVLEIKEKEEIERILTELSLEVADFADTLAGSYEALVALDTVFAKARYAFKTGGTVPALNSEGKVYLKRARHPLLPPKKAVPVTVGIGEEYDTLVITGPNTGGKTVTLKTIGLLTLMAACGLMIPADDGSRIAVFDRVFADIGDEQSIEQSLSTFSSHMVNIVKTLDECGANSLVLLDELCAGTDPVEGAAIAKAILMRLALKGAKTVATTHYPELKAYALDTPGVENAACEFNVETLRPTYRLTVGIPGASNAFAISERLGLSQDIIETAKEQLSVEDVHFEHLARELENQRKKAEDERLEAARLKSEILKTKKRCEELESELLAKQKKIIEESRRKANIIIDGARERSAVLLNELEEIKKGFNAETAAQSAERARKLYKDSIKEMEENADPVEQSQAGEKLDRLPTPGETVIVTTLNKEAQVVEVDSRKDKVRVVSGAVKMWVSTGELARKKGASRQKIPKTRTVGGTGSRAQMSVKGEIDLRGMTGDEAILELDKYLDSAILSGITQVTVIHGKGTGALRKAVQAFLKGHKAVASYRCGVFGEGEMGVTVVELK